VQPISMKRIIIAAVLKFFLKTAADFDSVVGGNSDVATVEKPVDVASEQQAVMDCMRATLSIRHYMRGFESRKRMFFGNRAGALIGIRDRDLEGVLAQARPDGAELRVGGRLPEVYFINIRKVREIIEPLIVSDANKEFHDSLAILDC